MNEITWPLACIILVVLHSCDCLACTEKEGIHPATDQSYK